jgi:hypothetical protein
MHEYKWRMRVRTVGSTPIQPRLGLLFVHLLHSVEAVECGLKFFSDLYFTSTGLLGRVVFLILAKLSLSLEKSYPMNSFYLYKIELCSIIDDCSILRSEDSE